MGETTKEHVSREDILAAKEQVTEEVEYSKIIKRLFSTKEWKAFEKILDKHVQQLGLFISQQDDEQRKNTNEMILSISNVKRLMHSWKAFENKEHLLAEYDKLLQQ